MTSEKKPVRWGRRPRLKDFDYSGEYAYHLTIVTSQRSPVLLERAAAVIDALTAAAHAAAFEVLLYTIMPDHAHALVQGTKPDANLIRLVQRWKQVTAYAYKHETGEKLWQESFFDRTIRRGDDVRDVARYIFENPVRAGLAVEAEEWAFSGGSMIEDVRIDD